MSLCNRVVIGIVVLSVKFHTAKIYASQVMHINVHFLFVYTAIHKCTTV